MFLRISTALLIAGALSAQTFEVASVKPSPPMDPMAIRSGKMHIGTKIDNARVDIGYTSLSELIRTAYDVKPYQVTGPDFIKTTRFDISAKMPEGATKEQVPAMLRALLEERFGLKVHKETSAHSIYALIVAKGGPKMKEAPADPADDLEDKPLAKGESMMDTPQGKMRITQNGQAGATMTSKEMGTVKSSMVDGNIHVEASKVSMARFAEMLNQFVDRPVLDQTGLKGNYQVVIDIPMQEMIAIAQKSGMLNGMGPIPGATGADSASDPTGGTVFKAVAGMGLKLDPKKDPLDMIVVDHIEKAPSEN